MSESKRFPLWVTILLVVLPLWLFASAGGALWYYFYREKKEAAVEQARFMQTVSSTLLEDDLRKIVGVVGERNTSSEEAAANLSRIASMIEGILGPSNTGYAVKKTPGPGKWPILQTTIRGKKTEGAIWVVTTYDSRPGSRGAETNGSGLASTMAAAQALAHDQPASSVHFVFLPHFNDPESPVLETATFFREKLVKPAGEPGAILCVEAMGGGSPLWISSREANAKPLGEIDGLGAVYGAEVVCLSDDTDLSSVLFEMDLPAVRVATRAMIPAGDSDEKQPSAHTVAGSTGRLIELIRRCSGK